MVWPICGRKGGTRWCDEGTRGDVRGGGVSTGTRILEEEQQEERKDTITRTVPHAFAQKARLLTSDSGTGKPERRKKTAGVRCKEQLVVTGRWREASRKAG
ncbi:hypothetical protein TRVL_04555 [Trypanosoma vivax]|nr:hypothetical protein TRVL_04555 [Trypanosoma vivax]